MLVGSCNAGMAINVKYGINIKKLGNEINLFSDSYDMHISLLSRLFHDKNDKEIEEIRKDLYSAIIRDYENGKKYFDLDEYFNKNGEN